MRKVALIVDRGCGQTSDSSWGDSQTSALAFNWTPVWAHLTLVYDHGGGGTGTFTFYSNDSQDFSLTYSGGPLDSPASQAKLGDNGRDDHTKDCDVKAIQVWEGVALNQAQVTELHSAYLVALA